MSIELRKDTRKYLLESIQRFFDQELEQDIGDLKAGHVLDFFLVEIAPSIYNQAMTDAQGWLQERLLELPDVKYQPEFDFWKKR